MPDYSVTSRDPYLRAKAVAEAQVGPSPARLLTGLVCLVVTLIALVLVGCTVTELAIRAIIGVACVPIALATLAAVVRMRSLSKKRSHLIDELWRTYAAEASQVRTGPTRLRPFWGHVPCSGRAKTTFS